MAATPDTVVVVVGGEPFVIPKSHLRHALAVHAQWCRPNGIKQPVELGRLLEATSGQERSQIAVGELGGKDGLVDATHVTYAVAAARLGVSKETVRRRVKDGTLPALRLGRLVRIPVSALGAEQ